MMLIDTIKQIAGINDSIKNLTPKTFDELMKEIGDDEIKLNRIDRIKWGTKVYCIKSFIKINKTFDNFKDYLNYFNKPEHQFNEGEIYTVKKIENYLVYISGNINPNVPIGSSKRFSLIGKYLNDEDFFEYFMLESEWIALERDKKIDDIIN